MSTTTQILAVPELWLHVVTGKTCYPGEDRFSAIVAELKVTDPEVESQLARAKQGKTTITCRCAGIDVTGRVTKQKRKGFTKVFVISVEGLCGRWGYAQPAGGDEPPPRSSAPQ